MSCKEMNFKPSNCDDNSLPKIVGIYFMKDGVSIYKKSNGELFTYQNDAAGLKALELVQKYEFWQATFKPQSQKVINTIIITGIVLAMAEIVWFWLTKY